MNENNIVCPQCQAEFPLGEAVAHRLREQLAADFEKERAKLKQAGAREASEKLSVQMKDLQAQVESQQSRLKAAEQNELTLRKQQRELQHAKDSMQLEVERKLQQERDKIAETARKNAEENEKLKLLDKENKIKQLTEQIDLLQKKAAQGSIQAQGETLELELERELKAAFMHDEIVEVKKGERGADVRQSVRTNAGGVCGEILWEAKRAGAWSSKWIAKTKDDQRHVKADLAVIVTTCPPEGLHGFGQHEGVWVCEPGYAVALAAALRQGIVSTAAQRVQQANRADNMSMLYDYLCGVEFRQHIEALVETFVAAKKQIESERKAFHKAWAERDSQLTKAVTHTALIYGGIQGIAGREALPEIDSLALTAA